MLFIPFIPYLQPVKLLLSKLISKRVHRPLWTRLLRILSPERSAICKHQFCVASSPMPVALPQFSTFPYGVRGGGACKYAYGPALLWYVAHFGSSGSALALTHYAISSVWNVWAKRVPRRLLRIGTISFLPLCRAKTIIGNIFPVVNKIL